MLSLQYKFPTKETIFCILINIFPLFLGGNRPFAIILFGLFLSLLCLYTMYKQPRILLSLSLQKYYIISIGLTLYPLISAILISPHSFPAIAVALKYGLYYIIFIMAFFYGQKRGFLREIYTLFPLL